MTYIACFRNFGLNTIISDTRVTKDFNGQRFGVNIALKTGVLYNGCIYGLVGNSDRGREFLLAFLQTLPENSNPKGSWSLIERFISGYNFPVSPREHFQIILSTRHSDPPDLYLLDSARGKLEYLGFEERWFSFGTGKPILDSYVGGYFIPQMKDIIKKQRLPFTAYPYVLCFKLTQFAQTFERSLLERYNVGGVFHCIFQVHDGDVPQSPSFYYYLSIDHKNKKIYTWGYRVCRVKNGRGVAVDILIPPKQDPNYPQGRQDRSVFFDNIVWPNMPSLSDKTFVNQLGAEIKSEIDSQPLYYFCGIGFSNPLDRRAGLLLTVTGEKKYVLDSKWQILPEIWKYLVKDFE